MFIPAFAARLKSCPSLFVSLDAALKRRSSTMSTAIRVGRQVVVVPGEKRGPHFVRNDKNLEIKNSRKSNIKSDGQECPSHTGLPQRLKPAMFIHAFAARLKSCPSLL